MLSNWLFFTGLSISGTPYVAQPFYVIIKAIWTDCAYLVSVSHATKLVRVNRGETGLPVPLQDTSQPFITMFYSQRLHQIRNKSGIEIITQQWILNHLKKVKKSD